MLRASDRGTLQPRRRPRCGCVRQREAGGSEDRPLAAVFTDVGRKLRQERFAAALLVVLSRSWRPGMHGHRTLDAFSRHKSPGRHQARRLV
jgi:hypothetical protein